MTIERKEPTVDTQGYNVRTKEDRTAECQAFLRDVYALSHKHGVYFSAALENCCVMSGMVPPHHWKMFLELVEEFEMLGPLDAP